MILTPDQKIAAMYGGDVDADIERGAIRKNLWPGGVLVYEIDTRLGKRDYYSSYIKVMNWGNQQTVGEVLGE